MAQDKEKQASRTGTFVDRHHMLMCDGIASDALLLSQILFHSSRKPDGWFNKSHKDWYAEIGIKDRLARDCLKRLKDSGLIEYELRGFAGTKMPFMRIHPSRYAQILADITLTDTSEPSQIIPPDVEEPILILRPGDDEATDEKRQIDESEVQNSGEEVTKNVTQLDEKRRSVRRKTSLSLTENVEPNNETLETPRDSLEIHNVSNDTLLQAEIQNASHILNELISKVDSKPVPAKVTPKIVSTKAEKTLKPKKKKATAVEADNKPQSAPTPKLESETALMKAVAFCFDTSVEFGNMNGLLRGQLRGRSRAGERKTHRLTDPATPAEIVAFKFWWKSTFPDVVIPTKANTLHDRFLHFRGDKQRYDRAMERGEAKLHELLGVKPATKPEDDEPYLSPEENANLVRLLGSILDTKQTQAQLANMNMDEYYAYKHQQIAKAGQHN